MDEIVIAGIGESRGQKSDKGAATTVITQRNKDPMVGRYERLLDGGIGDAERR